MAWTLRWIVDLFNALASWYYRRKYGASARQLGRLPHEKDGQQGFVIIEIDGLAHHYLKQALKQGYMPYVARLILGRRLRLARWRCGLPSTTPASQAGIMYGNNWDIPGFRWYDKQAQSSIVCKQPGSVRAIQDRISTGRAGLLRGGSSYTNLFDGDARLALFTLSALGRDRLFENVRGLGFLVLFSLHPLRFLKLVGLSLWTWAVYVAKRMAALIRPSTPRFTFLGPLLEIFNNIIFREVTTFSTMVDIYRGMPAIYAGYTGYDEIAHHFGADSQEAFRALRGLDKQIRQIDRIRQVYVQRAYDLFILSDHGMTRSVPFRHAYGQTLQQLISAHTGQAVQAREDQEETEGLPEARMRFLVEELRAVEAQPHLPFSARLLSAMRLRLEQQIAPDTMGDDWDLSRREDIVVKSSGSLSHIYFNVTTRVMDLSEIAFLYPGLIEALAGHAGIQLVVGREEDAILITGRGGTLWEGPDGQSVEGEDPLLGLDDPRWALAQITRLARFPHAGDLILLGDWDGDRVICFEEQVASHGGLGGPQALPFILYPPGERLSARGIQNAEELYARFRRVYGEYS